MYRKYGEVWTLFLRYMIWHTCRQAGGFLRPDFAPSSERPQFGMPSVRNAPELRSQHDAAPPVQLQYPGEHHAAAAMPCHCRNRRRGKLQNLSPPSVLFESSRNFFIIHRRHRRKKWWSRILKFEFCDFWEFFEIFKKASRGPSAANLDHYGRGQTRSQ